MSEKYQVYDIAFGEFDIEERDEFKFLRENENAVLIGDGENGIIAALNDEDTNQKKNLKKRLANLQLYILRDEHKDAVEGPFTFKDFITTCNEQQPEEEEEEENQEEQQTEEEKKD